MASSFAARGVEKPVGVAAAAPTFTQQMTAQFMAPAKKEFSAQAFVTDLAIVRAPARRISRTATASIGHMTRVDDRTRASPPRARARPQASGRASGFACTSHLLCALRAPARPALTRALPPSRNRVFTGRHLRSIAKTATAPIERVKLLIQTQDANPKVRPPNSNEAQNRKPRLPAFEPIAPRDARSRARARAERETRARRARRTRPAFSCPYLSVGLGPAPPPPRPRPRGRRRDGSVAPPAKRRRRRLSVSAARERRFRASHLAVARQIFGDLSCERASLEKGVFARFRKKFFH